jgi:23S rRNA (adenine2503-C2)-methyltransferase
VTIQNKAGKARKRAPSPTPRSPRPGRAQPDARRAPQAKNPATVDDRSPVTPQSLLGLYRPDLAGILMTREVPSYRYTQVCEHLFRRPLSALAEATVLPGELRDALDPLAASTLTEIEAVTSPDGTTKLLLSGRDGSRIETVIMRFPDRATVCISSQCGCPVECRFCATGAMGFRRNLTPAEIVDQVRAAAALVTEEGRRVSNLVYMGMGEPLLNLRPVLDSVRILTHPRGQGLAHRALSISTVGIPRGILRLAHAEPQVNLALSLHAPDDRTRALLVPERYRHTVKEVLEAAWRHFDLTHRKLLIEYVLVGGINDSIDQARMLASLVRGHVVTVNLMTWNPTPFDPAQLARETIDPARTDAFSPAQASRFRPATPAAVAAFKNALLAAHVETVVRRSRGAPIRAACGQLAGRDAAGKTG